MFFPVLAFRTIFVFDVDGFVTLHSLTSKTIEINMPKVKIGEKVVAGENKVVEKKIFTNGHKFFTSAEAKALLETQSREKRASERFETNKSTLIKPRNPITGDVTPRVKIDAKGDIVEKTGSALFPATYVGNNSMEKDEKRQNPLARADRTNERISSLQLMQDTVGGEIEYLKMKIKEKQSSVLGSSSEFRF
jgi:hypothetical protein